MLSRFFICLTISFALLGCGGASRSEFKIPPEATARKNPFAATRDSIAQGNQRYHSGDCAICHGKNGDGKGVLAKDISMNLHNWHDRSVQDRFTDGDLFYIMDQGKGSSRGRMPAYHDQETPEQIWYMVNYIRSFAAANGPK